MFMPQRSEFAKPGDQPSQAADGRILKDRLSLAEQAITLGDIALASRKVMADSEKSGWFCLQVEQASESAVEKTLSTLDIEAWLPRHADRKICRRGREKLVSGGPIAAGYVLFRCAILAGNPRGFKALERLEHAHRIVGGAANPQRIRNEELLRFKKMVDECNRDEARPKPPFEVDEEVFVTLGPWADFRAIVVSCTKREALVEVSVFGRSSKVSMPLAYFRKL